MCVITPHPNLNQLCFKASTATYDSHHWLPHWKEQNIDLHCEFLTLSSRARSFTQQIIKATWKSVLDNSLHPRQPRRTAHPPPPLAPAPYRSVPRSIFSLPSQLALPTPGPGHWKPLSDCYPPPLPPPRFCSPGTVMNKIVYLTCLFLSVRSGIGIGPPVSLVS